MKPVAEKVIHGFPAGERARARTVYKLGLRDATLRDAEELERLLLAELDDPLSALRAWVKITKETIEKEDE